MVIDYNSRGPMILLLETHYTGIEVCVHLRVCTCITWSFLKRNLPSKLSKTGKNGKFEAQSLISFNGLLGWGNS